MIEKLKKGLHDTTVNISSMVYEAVSHSVDKALENSSHRIKESARYAENVFAEYQASLSLSHWKLIAITAFSSILASLLIVRFLMPEPLLPLASRDMQIYEIGKSFSEVWPTLSKEKQRWFLEKSNRKVSSDQTVEKQVDEM